MKYIKNIAKNCLLRVPAVKWRYEEMKRLRAENERLCADYEYLRHLSSIESNMKYANAHTSELARRLGGGNGHLLATVDALSKVDAILADDKSREVLHNIALMHLCRENSKIIEIADAIRERGNNRISTHLMYVDGTSVPIICDNDQYYPNGIIELSDYEVYLDAGMFDGKSVTDFVDRCKGHYKAIYAFEASRANFANRLDALKQDKDPRIKLFNIGLAKSPTTVYFPKEVNSGAFASDTISDVAEEAVLHPLHSVLTPEQISKITFIKMDIEGYELEVLQSIEDDLIMNKPKLAISVYHKPDDIIEIPIYIHSLAPEYKIYIRHHTNWFWETVLYAVAD